MTAISFEKEKMAIRFESQQFERHRRLLKLKSNEGAPVDTQGNNLRPV